VDHDVKTYPEAGHSFMSHGSGPVAWIGARTRMRAGYAEAAAEDAWARMLAFFDRHLGPAS
jgi:carboxymethylenebutenolidase